MPRKPVTLSMVGGKGPRQRIWEAIRRLSAAVDAGDFTERDIWAATEGRELIELTAIVDYRRCLVAAGVLAQTVKPVKKSPARYRLLRDEGLEAPRLRRNGERVTQGLAQEQMWRTLRMLRGDTNARELAAHASTPAIPVAESAAGAYLRMLDLAGYLDITAECVRDPQRRSQQARYRLRADRNTGPRPPMVCRVGAVFDPNEGAVVWQQQSVTEEDAIYGH